MLLHRLEETTKFHISTICISLLSCCRHSLVDFTITFFGSRSLSVFLMVAVWLLRDFDCYCQECFWKDCAAKWCCVISLKTPTLAEEQTLQTSSEEQRAHKQIAEQTTCPSRNLSLLNEETWCNTMKDLVLFTASVRALLKSRTFALRDQLHALFSKSLCWQLELKSDHFCQHIVRQLVGAYLKHITKPRENTATLVRSKSQTLAAFVSCLLCSMICNVLHWND